MCRLRRGVARTSRGLPPAGLGLLGLALALAGCATSAAEPTQQPIAQVDRGTMEDDGLPAQVAPPIGIPQQPDDPREPFSPDYGPRPSALPPALSRPPVQLSEAEADALVARAITAHEIRRP